MSRRGIGLSGIGLAGRLAWVPVGIAALAGIPVAAWFAGLVLSADQTSDNQFFSLIAGALTLLALAVPGLRLDDFHIYGP